MRSEATILLISGFGVTVFWREVSVIRGRRASCGAGPAAIEPPVPNQPRYEQVGLTREARHHHAQHLMVLG